MTDGIPITPGTGETVATDDAGASGHVQIVKLAISTDGSATVIPADADNGLYVAPKVSVVRPQVTPTISNASVYAANDCIGGVFTFSNAASHSGGAIRIESLQMVDKGAQGADMELFLFDRDLTVSGTTTVTDNVGFDPVDGDLSWCIGSIPISLGFYAIFTDNAVCTIDNVGIEAVLNGTDLFGVMVSRDTPTYSSTSDLVVALTIRQLD